MHCLFNYTLTVNRLNMRLIILFITFIFIGCKSDISKEIEKSCIDCSETSIRKSDLILVTNKNGESNVFSRRRMSFMLSKWYPAKYDEGVIFDDITFTVNGQNVMCSEDDYKNLSDNYISNKLNEYTNDSRDTYSTVKSYRCVVCGKECENVSAENIYLGHHVKIGNIPSSDVVCGISCDLKLRETNEEIIRREIYENSLRRKGYTEGEINQTRDPNLGDPEIKASSKKVFDAIERQTKNRN